jgi:hypothetical protein
MCITVSQVALRNVQNCFTVALRNLEVCYEIFGRCEKEVKGHVAIIQENIDSIQTHFQHFKEGNYRWQSILNAWIRQPNNIQITSRFQVDSCIFSIFPGKRSQRAPDFLQLNQNIILFLDISSRVLEGVGLVLLIYKHLCY